MSAVFVGGYMGKVLKNVIIYISLVFRPWVLLKIEREHRECLDDLDEKCRKLGDMLLRFNPVPQTHSCKWDK